MRWLARTLGAVVGLLVVVGIVWATFHYLSTSDEMRRKREIQAASRALRQELQLDGHVSVLASLDENAPVGAKVEYLAAIPDEDRRNVIVKTNLVVRRYLHDLGEVKVVFAGGPNSAGEALVGEIPVYDADAGRMPVPVATAAPIAQPSELPPAPLKKPTASKKKGPVGTFTLVTFPDAQVFNGSQLLGKTPLFNVELPVGTHLLTVVGDDGIKRRLSLPVRPGKGAALKMKLDELPTK